MHVSVIDRDGMQRRIEAAVGRSLMLALVEANLDVEAACGGVCSCATCHVHVDPAWCERLSPPAADETALLEGSVHRGPTSRLACQIAIEPRLDGLTVTLAAHED